MTSIIAFPANDTLVEIFVGNGEYLVAVNESGIPFEAARDEYGGTIYWNGTSYDEARREACELLEEFGGRIVDLTA
jgi:hypothetical protein